MKATIYIDGKTALLAGLDNQGDYTIDFDPADLTPEQRTELALSDTDNDDVFKACVINHTTYSYGIASPDLDALRTILNKRIVERRKKDAERAAEAAKRDAEDLTNVLAWAHGPSDKLVRYDYRFPRNNVSWPPCYENNEDATRKIAKSHPEVQEAIEDAEALVFWLNAEQKIREMQSERWAGEAAEKEAAEKEAADARRAAQLSAWVAKHGTENQRARALEGLLPEDEIIDAIRAVAYAPLDALPRYEKIKRTDFCECDGEYQTPNVDFDVEDADDVSADEYDQICKIRALMPRAAVTLRRHSGGCETCKNEMTLAGIMVRLTVGEFSLSREYAVNPYSPSISHK
jgi:hypothetical protein